MLIFLNEELYLKKKIDIMKLNSKSNVIRVAYLIMTTFLVFPGGGLPDEDNEGEMVLFAFLWYSAFF